MTLFARYRHRGRAAALLGGGVPGAASTAFVASIGTGALDAYYDLEFNVGRTGSLINTIDDFRGTSGFGPQVVFSGTSRALYDAGAFTATGDGLDDRGSTVSSAKFVMSGPKTLGVIGTFPTGDSKYMASISNTATPDRLMALQSAQGGVNYINAVYFVPGRHDADSTVLVSATRRIAMTKKSGTTAMAVRVYNAAEVAPGIGAAIAAGNNTLTLFDYHPNGGAPAAGVLRAAFVINREATADDWNAIVTLGLALGGS